MKEDRLRRYVMQVYKNMHILRCTTTICACYVDNITKTMITAQHLQAEQVLADLEIAIVEIIRLGEAQGAELPAFQQHSVEPTQRE